MLTIDDFKKPTDHPWGMLKGSEHANEEEAFMAWFLFQCIEKKDIDAEITTRNNEDHMIVRGLLEKVGKQIYRLTAKSKGLLYAHYAK